MHNLRACQQATHQLLAHLCCTLPHQFRRAWHAATHLRNVYVLLFLIVTQQSFCLHAVHAGLSAHATSKLRASRCMLISMRLATCSMYKCTTITCCRYTAELVPAPPISLLPMQLTPHARDSWQHTTSTYRPCNLKPNVGLTSWKEIRAPERQAVSVCRLPSLRNLKDLPPTHLLRLRCPVLAHQRHSSVHLLLLLLLLHGRA